MQVDYRICDTVMSCKNYQIYTKAGIIRRHDVEKFEGIQILFAVLETTLAHLRISKTVLLVRLMIIAGCVVLLPQTSQLEFNLNSGASKTRGIYLGSSLYTLAINKMRIRQATQE